MPKLRLCGGVRVIGTPFRLISPAVGDSNPASIINVVVLPEPEGPSSDKNSPRRISRFRSRTTRLMPS